MTIVSRFQVPMAQSWPGDNTLYSLHKGRLLYIHDFVLLTTGSAGIADVKILIS